jgi:hypothetical protein
MWMLLILLSAVPAMACDKNCEPHGDVCACEQAPDYGPTVKPSDERPPNHGGVKEPVMVDMPQNLSDQDRLQDKEIINADAEGKKAAGIPTR